MQLEGSCHCGAVRFTVESAHPYPFNLCYCSICRKTAGGGGFAINLGADHDTLKVSGEKHLGIYRARLDGGEPSEARRYFCRHCASALWVWDSRWPELVHPFASAIDSGLPMPPERTHLMLGSKASWVEPCFGANDRRFDEYPEESIAEWHERLGLADD
ncbi:MAG: GFA family protein [Gammaproteobacteria bacterium]|nr:GFA family protein [Gammaproteobacteria bacterium]